MAAVWPPHRSWQLMDDVLPAATPASLLAE